MHCTNQRIPGSSSAAGDRHIMARPAKGKNGYLPVKVVCKVRGMGGANENNSYTVIKCTTNYTVLEIAKNNLELMCGH